MSTTAIFVELLIIGIQAAVWIILLCQALFPGKVEMSALENYEEWAALFTVIIFALCYTVGMIIDRIADKIFSIIINFFSFVKILNCEFFKILFGSKENGTPIMQVTIKEQKAVEYFAYIRSRMRIMRSTTLNILITTLVIVPFALEKGISLFIINFIFSIGLILTCLCFILTLSLECNFNKRQEEMRKELKRKPNKKSRNLIVKEFVFIPKNRR